MTATPARPEVNPAALAAWRQRMGWTTRDVERELGCSRRAWIDWESGKKPAPPYIALACAALALNVTGLTAHGKAATG